MSTGTGGELPDLEVFRNLLKTQAAFVHEHTGAAREEAATTLALAQELELRVEALENQRIVDYNDLRRASLTTAVQTFLLSQLAKVVGAPEQASIRHEYIERLDVAVREMQAWTIDQWNDPASMEALKARLWPESNE